MSVNNMTVLGHIDRAMGVYLNEPNFLVEHRHLESALEAEQRALGDGTTLIIIGEVIVVEGARVARVALERLAEPRPRGSEQRLVLLSLLQAMRPFRIWAGTESGRTASARSIAASASAKFSASSCASASSTCAA